MEGLNLTIQPGKAPANAKLPGNPQSLLNFVAAYLLIAGGQTFNGLNYGASTPSPESRGIPWFKTDQFGNPIGFFSWNGTQWVSIPVVAANGPTSTRPDNPGVGTEYYDTSIGALLIYSSNGWTTASGTPGDLKFVMADTIDAALVANPGWVQATGDTGRVLAAAGDATAVTAPHPYGQQIGEETHAQLVSELPPHTHGFTGYLNGASANGNTGPGGILSDHNATNTQSAGGGAPFNVIQPTSYRWLLLKQF